MPRRGLTPLIFPEKKKLSFNYGEMPSYADFENNFIAEIGFGGTYDIRAGMGGMGGIPAYETRRFTAKQLYAWLKRLSAKFDRTGDEETGSVVSDVLGTLGFEWI